MHRHDYILFVVFVFILNGVVRVIWVVVGIMLQIDFSGCLLADEVALDHLFVRHRLDFARLIHRRLDLICQRMTLGLRKLRVYVG